MNSPVCKIASKESLDSDTFGVTSLLYLVESSEDISSLIWLYDGKNAATFCANSSVILLEPPLAIKSSIKSSNEIL